MSRSGRRDSAPTIPEVLQRAANALDACARSLEGNCDSFTILRVDMLAKEAERLSQVMARNQLFRTIRLGRTDRTGTFD